MLNGLEPEPLVEMDWKAGRAFSELLLVRKELSRRKLLINGVNHRLRHLHVSAAQTRRDRANATLRDPPKQGSRIRRGPTEQAPRSMFDQTFRMRHTGERGLIQ
jgi:hypothetical protein